MDKKEMQKRICCLEGDCKNLKTEIGILKAELAEAEKPKLKHGDFGISFNTFGRLTLKGLNGKMFSAGLGCCYDPDRGDKDHPKVIFGNIFKMMDGWGKDLTEFKTGCTTDDRLEYYLKATLENNGDYRIGTQDNTIIISANQVEIYWRKLGRMIMTRKRKQT